MKGDHRKLRREGSGRLLILGIGFQLCPVPRNIRRAQKKTMLASRKMHFTQLQKLAPVKISGRNAGSKAPGEDSD